METPFFTRPALEAFSAVQGKTVEQIVCCMWQNLSDPSQPMELIDHLQLRFSDGTLIAIGCNEEGDGLDTIKPDLRGMQTELDKEFGGKIKIYALNASATTMWKDVIGKELVAVQITKEGDHYRSDSVLLNFGDEKRTVSINPMDGLLLDYYEE